MGLSGIVQQGVQNNIDLANEEEIDEMKIEAESILADINLLMDRGFLSNEQKYASELAIELLVRIEATTQKKGWWFRSKRRLQLIQLYLGS